MQLPRFTLLESGSLLVSPAHLDDAGTYTCLATNSRGVDEASADLVVWGKAPASTPVSPGSAAWRGTDPAQCHGQLGAASHRARCGMELSGDTRDGLWPMADGFGWVQTGLTLTDATPQPCGQCQGLILSPRSQDTNHRPAAGPERHQGDQSHHELWCHPRPQRGCQVHVMGLRELGGPDISRSPVLPGEGAGSGGCCHPQP